MRVSISRLRVYPPSPKRFSTFVTLRLGSRVLERVALLGIGRGHQSARPSSIPSSVRRTYIIGHGTRTAGRGGRSLRDGGLFHHVQQCHTTAVFQSIHQQAEKPFGAAPLSTGGETCDDPFHSPLNSWGARGGRRPPRLFPRIVKSDLRCPRLSGYHHVKPCESRRPLLPFDEHGLESWTI